jgi:hypothetical protein
MCVSNSGKKFCHQWRETVQLEIPKHLVCFYAVKGLLNEENSTCQLNNHSWLSATSFNKYALSSCGSKDSAAAVNIYCLLIGC